MSIARELGLTVGAVSNWFTGQRVPSGEQRRALEEKLKIPADAWGVVLAKRRGRPPKDRPVELATAPAPAEGPGPGRPRAVVPAEHVPPLPPASGDPLADVRALAARCRVGMMTQGLTAAEAKSWQGQLMDALKMEQAMTLAAAASEDNVAKHPACDALIVGILDALAPWPDALDAVVAFLAPR